MKSKSINKLALDATIFISFKKTKPENRFEDAPDYEIARKLYQKLAKKGVNVFFSEETIPSIATDDYEWEIDRNIINSKIMIVIGTSINFILHPSLQMEWKEFNRLSNLPLSEQKFKRKLFSLLVDVNPHELEEAGFPPRECFEFQSINDIDYDYVADYLINALADDYYVELKNLSNKAFYQFFELNNLDSDYDKDLFSPINQNKKEYDSFTEYCSENDDKRILLTGNENSGRRIQIFDFWKNNLAQNLESRDIILYVPLYHRYFNKTKNIFEFLYHLYFSKLTGIKKPDNYKEFYYDLSYRINKDGYNFLLILDGFDQLPYSSEGLDKNDFIEFISPHREVLNKTKIIIRTLKRRNINRSFKELHLEPLPNEKIISYLKKNKVSSVEDYHTHKNLKYPKAIKEFAIKHNPTEAFKNSITLIDEIIDNLINDLREKDLGMLEDQDKFYHVLKYFLPIFTSLNPASSFSYEELTKAVFKTLNLILENEIVVEDTDYIEDFLFDELYRTSAEEFIKNAFIPYIVELAKFFENSEGTFYWKNDFILDYYRAKGVSLLQSQNLNISFENMLNELEKFKNHLIRPNRNSLELSYDILAQAENVYELLGNEDNRLIANLAIVLDSYGDEKVKYEFAYKALKVLLETKPDEVERNELANYLSAVAYVLDKSRVPLKVKNPEEDIALKALSKALELVKDDIDGKIIEAKIHGNLGSFWQKWFVKTKNERKCVVSSYIENAIEEHSKALRIREELINTLSPFDERQEEMKFGFRRSYTCIATDYYHKEDFSKSAEYNQRALEYGEEVLDPERYENCSRQVGSLINLFNLNNDWNIKNYNYLLDLLKKDFSIMENSDIINKNEIEDIHKKIANLIEKIELVDLDISSLAQLKDFSEKIDTAYEDVFLTRIDRLTDKISI